MLAKRFALLLAGLLTLPAAFGVSLAAQESSDADNSAGLKLAGVVRTPEGASVPGSTLRAIQTSSGKAWVSWTDENGKFAFPALPAGHYRVEISQLGFAPATQEIDLSPASQTPLEIKLAVGTLAAINAAAATENPIRTQSANPSASSEAAKSAASGTPPSNNGTPPSQNQNTAAANNGTPGGRPGGQQGGGRRAFQQVGLNAQNQNNAENTEGEQTNLPEPGGQLG